MVAARVSTLTVGVLTIQRALEAYLSVLMLSQKWLLEGEIAEGERKSKAFRLRHPVNFKCCTMQCYYLQDYIYKNQY